MNLRKLLLCLVVALIIVPSISFGQDYALDGRFSGGGGIYYLRQIGDQILWYGEEDAVSPGWSNVAHGVIGGDIINVIWADVPKGSIMQSGTLVLQIISNDEIILLEQNGEFFGTDQWLRIP